MSRISYIEIGGKKYPLSFSLMAQKSMASKHGTLENLQEKMSKFDEEGIDALVDFIEILIKQGCAYKNRFEKDSLIPDGASVVNGEWIPIEREEIMTCVQFSELHDIFESVISAVTNSNKREVIAEVKEEKNARPTQA